MGYHEQQGRYFDGTSWSVGWKQDGQPADCAVALFACGKEVAAPSVLNADLQGKGIIKLQVNADPKAAANKNCGAKKLGEAAPSLRQDLDHK